MARPRLRLSTEPRLASGGEAVARAEDGRVVFVEGAAPGEQVEAEVLETHARYLRARVVQVLEPGPSRVEPRCSHFGQCGGCALQHVDPTVQRSAKAEAFLETLRRVGRVDLARLEVEAPWGGEPWGYRTRARLAVVDGVLGYRAAHSRVVVGIATCPVLAPALEGRILGLAHAVAHVRGEHELELLAYGDRVVAHADEVLAEAVTGVVDLDAELPVDDGHGALVLDAAGFAQASHGGNAALLDTVERWTRERPAFAGQVVELYAGSGNFTRVLAPRAAQLVAIEGSRTAAERARRALPAHVEVVAKPVEKGLVASQRFTAAFADPPRAGLHADLPARLVATGIQELVMVSCDPGTFARDVGRLATQGLELRRVRLFDLYPHTAHAEVAGWFVRA